MLAYNVHLPPTFEVDRSVDILATRTLRAKAIKASLLVRTLEQARRLSSVLNDAPIGLLKLTDRGTIDHLLSPEGDAETERLIAFHTSKKN